MRNTLLFITIFCSTLLAANETRAQCSCIPTYVNISARGEFNLAYAVFVGKVVAIENTPPDNNDHYVQTVTFQVTRAWKHDVDSNLTITNRIDGCLTVFKKMKNGSFTCTRGRTGRSKLIAVVQGPGYWRRLMTT